MSSLRWRSSERGRITDNDTFLEKERGAGRERRTQGEREMEYESV